MGAEEPLGTISQKETPLTPSLGCLGLEANTFECY
jgi:hypothetical protein